MLVHGRGYFTGTAEVPFNIVPATIIRASASGQGQVGSTLSVSSVSTFDGDVNSTFAAKYQWMLDGEPIPGATNSTYTLTANEKGKVVWCKITANCTNYEGECSTQSYYIYEGTGKDESPAVTFAPKAPPARTVGPFTDVATGSYCADAVEWAYLNNITKGTSATAFSPADSCTRGQVLTFLWRAMGEPEPTSTTNPFTDVSESDYYYKPVLWAVEQGITTGTSTTAFSPNETCSFAHILTFIWRSQGKPGATGAGEWYDDAYAWANTNSLLADTNAAAAIAANCPRGDVVTYLYRILVK